MTLRSIFCLTLSIVAMEGNCLADTPIEGMYLIQSKKLTSFLNSEKSISESSQEKLEAISECHTFAGDGYVNSFRFKSSTCRFEFSTSYGYTPPPIGSPGQDFNLELVYQPEIKKPIKLSGLLVFTDGSLNAVSSEPIDRTGIPNGTIRINQDWRKNEFAVLVIFIDAKR